MSVAKREKEGNQSASQTNIVRTSAVSMQEDVIDLQALLMRLLDHWILILFVALLGAAIAAGYSFFLATPQYEATTKLYVLNNKDSAVNLSDLQISSQLTSDYQQVFNNWHVDEMVMQQLGLDYTYENLEKMITIDNPSNSRIISITAKSDDPEMAKKLADTYASVAREFITVKMETQTPTVFEEALLPEKPVSPKKARNIVIGFLGGFMLMAGIITVRFLMDDYIRTPEDIQKATGLPVLGTVMTQDERRIRKDIAKREKSKKGEEQS